MKRHFDGISSPLQASRQSTGGTNAAVSEKVRRLTAVIPCRRGTRSDKEIRGYHIQGSDEAIGHIQDCIVADETWEVRYLVVDASNWWLGKSVLIAPHWATRISWNEMKVFVDLTRQKVKDSPEWNAETAINREYETRLYDYDGRPADWTPGGFAESARPELR